MYGAKRGVEINPGADDGAVMSGPGIGMVDIDPAAVGVNACDSESDHSF